MYIVYLIGVARAGAIHIPTLRPPVSSGSVLPDAKSPASVDLLGLGSPDPASSSIPPLDLFAASVRFLFFEESQLIVR